MHRKRCGVLHAYHFFWDSVLDVQDAKGVKKLLLVVPENQAFAFRSIGDYSLPVSTVHKASLLC